MMKAMIMNRLSNLEKCEIDSDLVQKVKELEEWYEERKRIYNSPEQREMRRKRYEKMIAEGNARRERMYDDCKH